MNKKKINKMIANQRNKIRKQAQKSGKELVESPCMYCNSKPVYIGAAVYLKPDNEIKGQYNWQLRSLIDRNHRFLIMAYPYPKMGTVLIVLLSTSSYLNEEKRQGIKLLGKYHDNKSVYMDAQNAWVVPSECIKSVEYNLSKEDTIHCIGKFISARFKTKLIRGVENNEIVDKHIERYRTFANNNIDMDIQEREFDTTMIANYIKKLSIEEVNKYNMSITKEDINECSRLVTQGIIQGKLKTREDINRALMGVHILIDPTRKENFISKLTRGY